MTGSYSTYFGAISVKDPTYGAVGDGSHDDTTNIQAAFNVAMATNGPKTVIFPPGTYKIMSPLYLVNTLALNIIGYGAQIFYGGTGTEGNIYDTTNPTRTPALMVDGVSYSTFSGISFAGQAANAININFIGFYYFMSGAHGSTTQNTFNDCGFQNFGTGMLVDGSAQCDNGTLNRVQFQSCLFNGLHMAQSNAINWQVYGGGADHCALRSVYDPETGNSSFPYAAYSTGTGGIGVISGVSCSANQWDIINSGGQQMAVIGGSFEGTNFYNVFQPTGVVWSSVGSNHVTLTIAEPLIQWGNIGDTMPIVVSQIVPAGYNGSFTATITGAQTLTYPLASNPGAQTANGFVDKAGGGSISAQGSVIQVSGVTYRCGSLPSRWLDCTNSGTIVASGNAYGIAQNTGFGVIASLGNQGVLIMEGTALSPAGVGCGFTGGGTSQIYLRGTNYPFPYTVLFTNYTGAVPEWDLLFNTTFSGLPTANAKFKGLRGSITDSSVTTFLTNVAGGGSTTVPVFCDGTNWKVG